MSPPTAAPSAAPPDNEPFLAVEKECDLIMKGGITSGVVYPPAILKLAETYRFRGIGGTSAGAIAGAAAAAAEFGRENPNSTAGFAGLRLLREELRKPDFLFNLFQPYRQVRPLYDAGIMLKDALKAREAQSKAEPPQPAKRQPKPPFLQRLREARDLVQPIMEAQAGDAFHQGRLLGGFFGAAVAVLLLWPALMLVWTGGLAMKLIAAGWILGLITVLSWACATGGSFLYGALFLRRGLRAVLNKHRTFYGACSGMPEPASGASAGSASPALTSWLSERLNTLAGRDPQGPPLTIGDLKGKKLGNGKAVPINFQLVTTNLSHRQPYTLPMKEQPYVFRLRDMRKLFPEPVVRYLVQWGMEHAHTEVILPRGFYRFPSGNDLPLVVATRMSLSFPVLLSAVRLYSVKGTAFQQGSKTRPYPLRCSDLEENWFSDGGISSNFPIHMFDAWMPMRPTFGINLADSPLPHVKAIPRESPLQQSSAPPGAYLPQPRSSADAKPRPVPIPAIVSFLAAIFDTARNYRDNTQAWLPSYRERVVHVFLESHEGGLNLKMPPEVIESIEEKGEEAAGLLLNAFHFPQHRWVRMRVLMAQLEKQFTLLTAPYEGLDNEGLKERLRQDFDTLMKAQLAAREQKQPWYKPRNEDWCAEAQQRIDALIALIAAWRSRQQQWEQQRRDPGFFTQDAPYPKGILRVTPEL